MQSPLAGNSKAAMETATPALSELIFPN